ncbi:hypothetical protein FOZ60_014949 [Perkinsus olseni]|uniref:Uncharacterized protein n=1 Tax=Perkinsus olseni TaxID=32597 RepID=A0A7J6N9E4_PEROL|nr:hypothetical protein FOZ60_014949 [Perkinsus olseni]
MRVLTAPFNPMVKRHRRSEPLKTVFTETVDEGGWEVDDSLMDENTPAAANEPAQSTIRCCSPSPPPLFEKYPDAAPIAPIVPSLPPPPPEGYVLAELSDDEYIIAELSP